MPEAHDQSAGSESRAQDQDTAQSTRDAQAASSGSSSASAKDLLADLDLANLDLSVESVEERISPSETNVFDK
jgi:hypothetical protein